MLSRFYVILLNIIFGLHLRYFNGLFICRTELLRSVPLTSDGLAIYSEAKIRLLKRGASVCEIPFEHTGRKYGKSKAVTLKSFYDTIRTVFMLVIDIYTEKTQV